MLLHASDGKHTVELDANLPIGTDTALNPKQLLLSSLCGCTAMDVLSLLKKHKQALEAFEIVADAEMSASGHPKVFTKVHLSFLVAGLVDAEKLKESVRLSQTQYCGVSAMLSKATPISYSVVLNGADIASGVANFAEPEKK